MMPGFSLVQSSSPPQLDLLQLVPPCMRILAAALLAALTLTPTTHPMSVVVAGDSVAHGQGDESGRGLARDIDVELERLGVAHIGSPDIAINGFQTMPIAAPPPFLPMTRVGPPAPPGL